MKHVPAVTKTVTTTVEVEPAKVVFEVDDRVKLIDLSYILSLHKNASGSDDDASGWHNRYDTMTKYSQTIYRKYVTIVELNLRVPAVDRLGYLEVDKDGNFVYLDAMVKDDRGDLLLTRSEFFRE
jgi:hypothetical protein